MKLVEFTITSPDAYNNHADFTAAYFNMFNFDDYSTLCDRLQAEGKLLYKTWTFEAPSTFKGVYLFADQAAVNEYWSDPVNDNPAYDSAMSTAGFSLSTQSSEV